jgi:predicted nucleic acid-binding protein
MASYRKNKIMKSEELLLKIGNIYYPNIIKLRKIIQNINDKTIEPFFNHKFEYINFCFGGKELKEFKRDYNDTMDFLEFYYEEDGAVILRIDLSNLKIESLFNDNQNSIIEKFLKYDASWISDLEVEILSYTEFLHKNEY